MCVCVCVCLSPSPMTHTHTHILINTSWLLSLLFHDACGVMCGGRSVFPLFFSSNFSSLYHLSFPSIPPLPTTATIRLLTSPLPASLLLHPSPWQCRISYIDPVRTTAARRQDIYRKWWFFCECKTCLNEDRKRFENSIVCGKSPGRGRGGRGG